MSDRGWWTESRTRRFPRARRDSVITRLWAVKLSKPDVGSSKIKIPEEGIDFKVQRCDNCSVLGLQLFLTGVPQKLDGDADPPPLSSRNSPHVVVAHPGVGTLPQPQLCDDVIHLPEQTARTHLTWFSLQYSTCFALAA